MLIGYISALFFGIRWYRGRSQFKSVMQKIRGRGGPLGEEGKEIEAVVATAITVTSATVTPKTTEAE
jgi:hypothetical protein